MQGVRRTATVLVLLLMVMASTAPAQKTTIGPQESAWVKLCEKANAATKDKDGKAEKKEINICLTHHERLDGNTGMVQVAAAVRQVEGQDKQHLMVMVPLGAMNESGLWATFYPKELWEKQQTGNHGDVYGAKLNYAGCHGAGCVAEIEATPTLISQLQINGGFVVSAIDSAPPRAVFAVPLAGFAEAFTGPPVTHQSAQPQRMLACAAAMLAAAEWNGCSMKPIHKWGR